MKTERRYINTIDAAWVKTWVDLAHKSEVTAEILLNAPDKEVEFEEWVSCRVRVSREVLRERVALNRSIETVNSGGRLISLLDIEYPEPLLQLHAPPLLLWVKGASLNNVFIDSAVAVVGMRNSNAYGNAFAEQTGKFLVDNHVSVISGLALGIDGAAHRGALKGKGALVPTVAVLGSGLDRVYPARHHTLASHILERGGTLVSQYAPGTPPYPSHFLERNHIIAALSHGVLVIQAALRSGALSTARAALEIGKDVMCVPGAPADMRSQGTNNMIRQGAMICAAIEDSLELSAVESAHEIKPPCGEPVSGLLQYILMNEPVTVDEVRRHMSDVKSGMIELLHLEISGKIKRCPDGTLITQPVPFSRHLV